MDKASSLLYHQYRERISKIRRLTMVTSNGPIPMVELIMEGVIGRAANAAASRFMDRVC